MGQQQDGRIEIDRAAILAEVYKRNHLRIEAKLPRLDVRAEYEHAVRVRAWRLHIDRHHDRVRSEILAAQRARHGEGWGLSWGGRMALTILTRKALEATFPAAPSPVGTPRAVS